MAVQAEAAGRAVVEAHGLAAGFGEVLQRSNRLVVRLRPADVVARIAPESRPGAAAVEIEVARRLAQVGAPIAGPHPRFEPRVHRHGGFLVTVWTHHRPMGSGVVEPADFAAVMARLHTAMRAVDLTGIDMPHLADRIAEARRAVDGADGHPFIGTSDRALLAGVLEEANRTIGIDRETHQLLHGEPHPGNVLATREGLLLADLETCCRGPVEFDLAHFGIDADGPPTELADLSPGTDRSLVHRSWLLTQALGAAWRCEPGDRLPDGAARTRAWIKNLREALSSPARRPGSAATPIHTASDR